MRSISLFLLSAFLLGCSSDVSEQVRSGTDVAAQDPAKAEELSAVARLPENPPNVLLLLVDSLRADRLSLYGNSRRTSPYISELADRALVCDRAFSHSPWTMPSMATLFTSTYESVHQLSMIPDEKERFSVLDAAFTTAAEYFGERGYRTAAISAQPWVSKKTGFDQGFDEFFVVASTSQKHEAEKVALKGLEWLRAHRDQRFFLYLHFMTPHIPYNPPPPFSDLPWIRPAPAKFLPLRGRPHHEFWEFMMHDLAGEGPNRATSEDVEYLLSLYDAEVAHVDWWIGVVDRALKRLGLADDTLVVLVADHGESFYEHGMLGHDFHLYNENLHIPLIFSHPGLFPETSRTNEIVGIVDILPTVVDLFGMEKLSQYQGRSIISGRTSGRVYSEKRIHRAEGLARLPRALGTEVATAIEKIQNEKWSLIYDHRREAYELYDLETDPEEKIDLFGDDRKAGKQMISQLMAARAANQSHPYKSRVKTTTLDDETVELLRSLGYLD